MINFDWLNKNLIYILYFNNRIGMFYDFKNCEKIGFVNIFYGCIGNCFVIGECGWCSGYDLNIR